MRILIVEDDARLAQTLSDILSEAGYLPEIATEGAEAEYRGATEIYAAVVLDLGLPGMAGIDVLRAWRAAGHDMPVLILTARSDWSDKIAGFRAGADDYVVKPVRLEEVLLRLQSLIRRAAGHATMDLSAGPLRLDVQTGLFTLDGRALRVTAFEQRLLNLLMHHKGRVVTRSYPVRAALRWRDRPRLPLDRGGNRALAAQDRARADRDASRTGLPARG